jgi:DNA-binding GntR family transcriptional regulator
MATLKQQAYEHIRNKLLRGELPPGSRLSNRKLAAEIGVSFIPIREAISQLASEGLVEHRSNIGAIVRTPAREELVDLYDLRLALECHAAKSATQHMGPVDIAELEGRNQQMMELAERLGEGHDATLPTELNDQLMVIDAAFHLAILRVAGNSLVIKTVSGLRVLARIFGRRRWVWDAEALRLICEEHSRIIECFRRRDAEGSCRAMADHIERGQRVALEVFDRDRASDAAMSTFSGELQNRIHDLEQS